MLASVQLLSDDIIEVGGGSASLPPPNAGGSSEIPLGYRTKPSELISGEPSVDVGYHVLHTKSCREDEEEERRRELIRRPIR